MIVYKYLLSWGPNTVSMPAGSALLTVAMQHEAPHVWVLCDPKAPLVQRQFRVVFTGEPHECSDSYYVGTAFGELVYHVFDLGET